MQSRGALCISFLCYNTPIMKKTPEKIMYIGLAINIVLFVSKLWVSYESKSQAMIADAFNNLSDLLATIIMIVGVKLAAKPADRHHPYGHERYELIGGFLVSILMLYLGIDLIRSSLFSQSSVPTSKYLLIIVLVSIVLKSVLWFLYHQGYKETKSPILIAGSADSRNDVILSSVIGVSFLIQNQFDLSLDKYLGIFISLMISIDALKMIRGYMSQLIGERPSKENIKAIDGILKDNEEIMGYHDLVIHEYGIRNRFASVHVTVDDRLSLNEAHQIIEKIEEDIKAKTKIDCVVHVDPININDTRILKVREVLDSVIDDFKCVQSYHDLRIKDSILYIEVVVSDTCVLEDYEIIKAIEPRFKDFDYQLEIILDRNYLLS